MLYNIGEKIPGVLHNNGIGLYNLSFTRSAAKKGRETAAANRKSKNDMLAKSMKLCSCCKQEKSLLSFNEDSKTYTGYSSWCKECKKEAKKK